MFALLLYFLFILANITIWSEVAYVAQGVGLVNISLREQNFTQFFPVNCFFIAALVRLHYYSSII